MSTKNDISLIFRPLFIISVLLLALNDWVLKAMFHNFITGKLSDFAGIFAFAIFAFACIPSKKVFISWGIAFAFCWWKSPFSDSFIAFWSSHFFEIERTIDMTDLLAILVLPFANRYANADFVRFYPKKYTIYLMSFAVCAVFMATSVRHDDTQFTIPQIYVFPVKPDQGLLHNESANGRHNDSTMSSFFAISNKFSAIIIYKVNGEDYYVTIKDDYDQNQIIKEFEKREMSHLLTELKQQIPNHYQIDSLSGQKINQTDSKGQKQGIWKFSDKNIFYVIHYQNDVLHGNYTILDGKQPKIGGNFANNLAEGNWTFYDSIGKIKEKRIYSKGETIKKYIGDTEKNIDSRQSFKNKVAWALAFEVLLFMASVFWLVKEAKKVAKRTKKLSAEEYMGGFYLGIIFLLIPLVAFFIYMNLLQYLRNSVLYFYNFPPVPYYDIFFMMMFAFLSFFHLCIWAASSRKYFNLGIIGSSFLVYFVFYVLFNQFFYWELL